MKTLRVDLHDDVLAELVNAADTRRVAVTVLGAAILRDYLQRRRIAALSPIPFHDVEVA